MTDQTCGSCGAPGDPWHCNGCDVEVCDECCSQASNFGLCAFCACNPPTDDVAVADDDY